MKQIVDLSRRKDLNIGDQEAFVNLGYGVGLEIDSCHGGKFNFTAEALVKAGVSKHLIQYLNALVEIEAGAEAQLQLAAQLSPDVLDTMGLTLSLRAYLQAYVRARLELSLTLNALSARVQTRFEGDPLAQKIFQHFIDQCELAMGVSANAQVAFTAKADILCQGRLIPHREEKPGFDFCVNAEAAFMYGAGFEFYAQARLPALVDFFRITKDSILEDIQNKVASEFDVLPDKQVRWIFSTWGATLDILIDAGLESGKNKKELTFKRLYHFCLTIILDEMVDAYEAFLTKQVDALIAEIKKLKMLVLDIEKYKLRLEFLIHELQHIDTYLEVAQLFDEIIILLDLVPALSAQQEKIKHYATYFWLLGYLVDTDNKADWKKAPSYVQAEIKQTLNKNISILTNPLVFNYLGKSNLSHFILENTGNTGQKIKQVQAVLEQHDLSITDFLNILLKQRVQDQAKILDMACLILNDLFKTHVAPAVETHMKPIFSKDQFSQQYYDVVIGKTLHSVPKIFIPAIQMFLLDEEGSKEEVTENREMLSALINRFFLSLLGKNIAILSQELLNFTIDNVSHNIGVFEQKIEGRAFDARAFEFFANLEAEINTSLGWPKQVEFKPQTKRALITETRIFLLETLGVARASMGREAWQPQDVQIISESLAKMIAAPDGEILDFSKDTLSLAVQKVKASQACEFLAYPEGLEELAEVLQVISLKQLDAYLKRMPQVSSKYFLALTEVLLLVPLKEVLQALEKEIKKALQKIEDELTETLKELIQLTQEVAEVWALLEEVVERIYAETLKALGAYFDFLNDQLDVHDPSWIKEKFSALVKSLPNWLGFDKDTRTDKEIAQALLETLRKKAIQALSMHEGDDFKQKLLNNAKTTDFSEEFYATILRQTLNSAAPEIDDLKLKASSPKQILQTKVIRQATIKNLVNTDLVNHALVYIQKSSIRHRAENRKANLISRKVQRQDHTAALQSSNIHINSPLAIDVSQDQAPLYGKYLYLEIDFDQLDIDRLVNTQLDITAKDFVDANQRITKNEALNKIRHRKQDILSYSLVNIQCLVNGHSIDLKACTKQQGYRLATHLSTKHLQQGKNHLWLFIVTPSQIIKKHTAFYCDLDKNAHPSNMVYINLEKSVINTKGNDHKDARKNSRKDKEVICISNASERAVDLSQWTLRDANGHSFTFPKHSMLKPENDYLIFVGNAAGKADPHTWVATLQGRPIAILNNQGEFLSLADHLGRVVSHVYTGNPSKNANITFLE